MEHAVPARGKWVAATLVGVVLLGLIFTAVARGRMIAAWLRTPEGFVEVAGDARVAAEPGFAEQAAPIAQLFAAAVERVTTRLGRDFAKPPKVYVCGSQACLDDYAVYTKAAAQTYSSYVLVSPRLLDETQRQRAVLTHELTHLHLAQRMGWRSLVLPAWFNEGLATYVSGGGGAEHVSAKAARAAIRRGEHFVPTAWQWPLFPKTAHDFGLKPHMFYRQAMLFVAYLDETDAHAFNELVADLEGGVAFDKAYGRSLQEAFASFIDRVTTR